MKLFIFSDFQGEEYIPEGEPDMVVLLGDISKGYVKKIDKMYNCPKIGVLGNHDTLYEWEGTRIQNIHEEVFEYEGIKFAGFGGCPVYNMRPNQYSDLECGMYMGNLEEVDVVITHSNPVYDIKRKDMSDPHRGFMAFNTYIKEKQPKYFLHGHIHRSFRKVLGRTEIYSVFPFLELEIQ